MTPYFEGVAETLVILSKKNGKSTLIAALVIFHILTTPDAEAVVVAVTREQAEIILRQARGFIQRSPDLQKRLRVMRREIQSLDDGGRARVLAADEDTAEGVIPTLAIVDELHGAKSVALYDSLRMGLDGRHGQMITITIAGSSMASPLGQKRDAAYKMPGFQRDEKRRTSYVRSPNGQFVFLEWCLNPEDDPDNLDIVKLVNPAPWKTKETLAVLKSAVTPWSWKRLACGVWTEGEEPWIEPAVWDKLGDPELEIPAGSNVWIGVGVRRDASAIAVIRIDDGDVWAKVRISDEHIPLERIEAEVRDLAEMYEVERIVYHAEGFQRSADILEADGLPMGEIPQSPQRMMLASATFYKLVEEGRLHHDGDPELRAQVLAAPVKETERGWRFQNDSKMARPIDALIALAVVCHAAVTEPKLEPMVGWA